MTASWSFDDAPGLTPEVRAHVDRPHVDRRWRIWSTRREEWLRQDAMGWTSWLTKAGTWTETAARERADDMPAGDKAHAVLITDEGEDG